jgi:hypothetical protein
MLPRERVFAALEHREPDRIPWGEHWIDYNVYEDFLGRDTLVHAKMRETQAMWDGRRDEVVESYKRDSVDLVRALDMELICVQSVPPKDHRPHPMKKLDENTYRAGNGDIYRISATTHDLMLYKRNLDAYVAPTIASLEAQIAKVRNSPPEDPNDSRWEYARHVVTELGATHFVALLTDDVQFPIIGPTEEEGWMNLIVEPDLCRKQAEYWGTVALRQVEVAAKLGCDGVVPCGDLGSSTALMASPDIYRDMVYPWHKRYVAQARTLGLKVLKHCCGHVWPVIDELAELYDAYEGIQASAGMDIKKLKERVGDKLCLWGGIWHEHIILGSVDDVRNDARYSFEHAAPGGGYIMGSSHSLAVDAKKENVLEMKRCRDEWGIYPINPAAFRP